jgi:predicted signal transduction protein with EAL and GGDEF domain
MLEVTERAIMDNAQKSLDVVDCIREIGFRLAIGDFYRQVVRRAQRRRQGQRDQVRRSTSSPSP